MYYGKEGGAMRPKSATPRTEITNVRLTAEERAEMESASRRKGFPNLSEYIRSLHNSAEHADDMNGKQTHLRFYDSPKLTNGYDAKLRPSGHDISDKFARNNGGSVPPNLLALANTESNGRYQDYCREKGLPIHPARFPATIPEYFIRLLTDLGDLVVDPFAGSCVTGEAAEYTMRRWICCEISKPYLEGAIARFEAQPERKSRDVFYKIAQPCAVDVDEQEIVLPEDGGRHRPAHVIPRAKATKTRSSRDKARAVKAAGLM
jgi:DNA methylase